MRRDGVETLGFISQLTSTNAPHLIAAHPDGVKSLADNARAAGASEAEITEAVEVGYLFGGTAALVMGVNAFRN